MRASSAKAAACKILTSKEAGRALADEEIKEVWLLSVQMEEFNGAKVHSRFQPECNKLWDAFAEIFSGKLRGLPPRPAVEAEVDTGTEDPVHRRPYRRIPKERKECEDRMTELLEAGLIRP